MALTFEKSFASHPSIRLFNQEHNIGIDPSKIRRRSGKPLNFRCPDCKHHFRTKPHTLKNCRFCENQALCKNDDCSICFEKSLASRQFDNITIYKCFNNMLLKLLYYDITLHKKLMYWCLINKSFIKDCAKYDVINNDIHNPRYIFKSTNKDYKFRCINLKCNHTFDNRPCRVADLKDCPYCSPTNAKSLCKKEDNCIICYKKSFASHPRSNCWDYNEGKNVGKTPYDVFISGTYLADIVCDACNHKFQTTCNSISSGFWCGFCSGQRRCDDIICEMCNSKKLSSHPFSIYWNLDLNPNDIKPSDIALGNSHDKYWFNCPEKIHPPYQKRATDINGGGGCPSCLRKTEAKVGKYLSSTTITYKKEWTSEWLRNPLTKCNARIDFMILPTNIALEIDGLQHFINGRWKSKIYIRTDDCDSEETRMRDISKMKKCITNKISGMRMFQPHILSDKYDWKKWLNTAIEIISNTSHNIWVFPDNPIYEEHKKMCEKENIPYIIV